MKTTPLIMPTPQPGLKCRLDRVKDVPYVHIDMEDRNFLPNITLGIKTVKEVAAYSRAKLDVHLPTANPIKYIHELPENGISTVCGHMEVFPYPLKLLHEVRRTGMRAGLALNLSIPVE